MIGYICATMATDKRLNCNIVLIQNQDGTYQIRFVNNVQAQGQDLENEDVLVLEQEKAEEMPEELRERGMTFFNEIGCDDIF